MSNVENFRRQLNEALLGKQKAEAEAIVAARLRQQQETAQARESARQQQIAAETAEKQINQAVLKLDLQLSIKEYLEALRDQIAPKQKINKWGPDDGKIAYALVYQVKLRKVETSFHIEFSGEPGLGHGGSRDPVLDYGWRRIKSVIGIQLNKYGDVSVEKNQCTNFSSFYDSDLNPFSWKEYFNVSWSDNGNYFRTIRSRKDSILGKYNITSPDGLQQFTQALTDFYVGLKSGK